MSVLSNADRNLVLALINRRFATEVAALTKPQLRTLIAEADAYLDAADDARPATSLRGACSAPFAGTGANQVAARVVVGALVQALRAKALGFDIARIGGGE